MSLNHYPHHIGEFDKATRHLTRIERSIYRDLLDMYYDTESPIPVDIAMVCRKIIARSDEEATAVEQTLNEFFVKTENGWHHERCEYEIAKYRANSNQKSSAGKASAEAKRARMEQPFNSRSTAVQHPLKSVETEAQRNSTNQNQNQNQEPITKKKTKRLCPDAQKIIDHLNQKTGSKFTATDSNAKFIAARLSEGYITDDLILVVDQKTNDWLHDPKMREYLRPATLFNAEKFSGYVGLARASPAAKLYGSSFDHIDYSLGVNEDGTF